MRRSPLTPIFDRGKKRGTIRIGTQIGNANVTMTRPSVLTVVAESLAPTVMFDALDIGWAHLWWAEGPEYLAKGLADGADLGNWPDEITSAAPSGVAPNGLNDAVADLLNNQPATFWDAGSNRGMETASFTTLPQPYSVVVILAFSEFIDNSLNQRPTVVDSASGGSPLARIRWPSGQQVFTFSAGAELTASVVDFEASPLLYVAYANGSSSVLESCGEVVASGNAGTNVFDTIAIGNAGTDGTGTRMRGNIALIGYYAGDIRTDPKWSAFETYASSKYGVNLSRHTDRMVFQTSASYNARGLTRVGDYAYAMDADANEIKVYDLTALPSLSLVEQIALPSPVSPRRPDSNGSDVLYVPGDRAGTANDHFLTYDISDPTNLSLGDNFQSTDIDNPIQCLYRSGDRVHMLKENGIFTRIYTFDVSDPTNVSMVAYYDSGSQQQYSFVAPIDDDFLIAAFGQTIQILDDSNRATGAPSVYSTSPSAGNIPTWIVPNGDFAYISLGSVFNTHGLAVWDISDLTSTDATGLQMSKGLYGSAAMLMDGTKLYTFKGTGTYGVFTQLDISDPSTPVLDKGLYVTTPGQGTGLVLHDGFLIGTGFGGGIAVVEVN